MTKKGTETRVNSMANVSDTKDKRDGLTVVDPIEPTAASREKTAEKKSGRRPRRAQAEEHSGAKCRFFLQATSPTNGKDRLALGDELETEEQALVESLKRDIPFLRVEAWTAYADRQGTDMVIRKRAEVE